MGREELYTWYWWGRLREKDHFEEPSLNEEIILKWVIMMHFVGVYWIEVARGKGRRWEI
jgi:hypothetical protein